MNDARFSLDERIRIFLEAIENGEVLRVRYDKGSQPGSVRDVRPVAIIDGYLRAFDESSPKPKTFILEALSIASVDEPLTYIVRRTKRKTVNLEKLADSLRFSAPMPAFASVFGIVLTRRSRRDLKTQKKTYYSVWTQAIPPEYEFRIGDVFHYPKEVAKEPWGSINEHYSAQIAAVKNDEITFRFARFISGALAHKKTVSCQNIKFVDLLTNGHKSTLWHELIDGD